MSKEIKIGNIPKGKMPNEDLTDDKEILENQLKEREKLIESARLRVVSLFKELEANNKGIHEASIKFNLSDKWNIFKGKVIAIYSDVKMFASSINALRWVLILAIIFLLLYKFL